MKAMLIPANVATAPTWVEHDDSLDALQGLVGGFIQMHPYIERDDVQAIFHEEGKLIGLPPNARATEFLKHTLMAGDYIAGDCLLVGFDNDTGANRDLPAEIESAVPVVI